MHAISSYHGNQPINKQTQPQTNKQTGPITVHCATKLSSRCNYDFMLKFQQPMFLNITPG